VLWEGPNTTEENKDGRNHSGQLYIHTGSYCKGQHLSLSIGIGIARIFAAGVHVIQAYILASFFSRQCTSGPEVLFQDLRRDEIRG